MTVLSDEEVRALGDRGFFVRDGFGGDALARAAHAAAEAREDLRPAGIRRGDAKTVDAQVRQDSTAWITDDGAPWKELRARFETLRRALNTGAYVGLQRFDLQLARYAGDGGGYARHRDAFSDSGPNRMVTAIWYLNPGWREADGGKLRLHVGESQVDVAPELDRLVVFLSERVEHEVLPAFAPRFALTSWFYK